MLGLANAGLTESASEYEQSACIFLPKAHGVTCPALRILGIRVFTSIHLESNHQERDCPHKQHVGFIVPLPEKYLFFVWLLEVPSQGVPCC